MLKKMKDWNLLIDTINDYVKKYGMIEIFWDDDVWHLDEKTESPRAGEIRLN